MNESKTIRLARLLNNLAALGFSLSEAQRLRRIEMTLRRWATAECNGEIQRDEDNGDKPKRCYSAGSGIFRKDYEDFIPDREKGARKQLAAIMDNHPTLWAYNQGDPRGCALYVGRKSDIKSDRNEIIAKAQSWGAVFTEDEEGTRVTHGNKVLGFYDTEEAAARAYLKSRGASIPARDVLPLDQHYTRGVPVCL